MSTEKYQLVGTSLEPLCLMLLEDFLVLRSAMRFFTVKTFPWIAIGLVAVLVVSLVALFVTTPIVKDSDIPSQLEPGNEQAHVQSCACEPFAFAMDANGNVYFGKNAIGNVRSTSDLITQVKKAIAERTSRLAYTRGMDLNCEVPLRCTDDPVYIKTVSRGNNNRLTRLIRGLREAGINPITVIDRRKPQASTQ